MTNTQRTTTLQTLAAEHAYGWSGKEWYSTQRNVHDAINDLTAQAQRLAPRVAREALDTACTNTKPTGRRQAMAYDLVAFGFCLNHISEDAEAVELAGFSTARACEWFALCGNLATTTRPHPVLGDVPVCDRCNAKAEAAS